jgi:hypothetical protein
MIDLRCAYCDRYLKVSPKATTICTVICPDRKCKKENNVKIVFGDASDAQIKYKFTDNQNAKISDQLVSIKQEKEVLQSRLEDMKTYISELEGIIDG